MGNSWQSHLGGVIDSIIATVLIAMAIAILAYLKAKRERIAGPVAYGLVGGMCVAVLWVAFTGIPVFSKAPASPDSLEQYVKAWAEDMSLGVERYSRTGNYFGYTVTTIKGPLGIPVSVYRATDTPNFLQFQYMVVLTPEDIAKLNSLGKEQQEILFQELMLQLSTADVGYTAATNETPDGKLVSMSVVVGHSVLITDALTEGTFAEELQRLSAAVLRAKAIIKLSLYHEECTTTVTRPAR
jgi:hypothetical protein